MRDRDYQTTQQIDSPSSSSRTSFASNDSNDILLGEEEYKMERMDSFKSKRSTASVNEHHDIVSSSVDQRSGASGTTARVDVRDVRSRPSVEGDLTLEDLFDREKTAKENKSVLLSYELDRMGMGRYQWFVFFLCGLGYFVDLLWAQAFSLITVPLKNQTDFGAKTNIGTLSTAFSVGLTVGAFTWGLVVDVVGRRWSFYFTCLISSIFGLASGSPPTFLGLRIVTALVGFGVGGNVPIDATITMEVLPTNRRFLLALLSLFQPIGVLVACGIAYAFIPKYSCGRGDIDLSTTNTYCAGEDNMGWRYTLYTMGALTLAVFLLRFLVFRFRESPAFLVNQGQDERALRTVAAIAKTNKRPEPVFTMEDFREIEKRCRTEGAHPVTEEEGVTKKEVGFWGGVRQAASQLKGVRLLFHNKTNTRVTVVLWITYLADFWGFTIAGFYLPQILYDRGIQDNVSLSETYRDYVAIYAPGIAACLVAAALIEVPKVGRQGAMIVSSALMAASLFLYASATSQAASVGLNALEYFMQSLFNSILYAYTPEVYPSAVRGTAAGLTSTLGRLASIVAPLAADSLYNGGEGENAARNTIYMAGAVTLLCPVALILLPFDTRGLRSY